MRVILETIAGTRRVQEACEQLGICEQRFEAIRADGDPGGDRGAGAQAARVGRRRCSRTRRPRSRGCEERVAELEAELRVASVRAELAGVLPRPGVGSGKRSPRSGRAKESKRPGRDRGTPRSGDDPRRPTSSPPGSGATLRAPGRDTAPTRGERRRARQSAHAVGARRDRRVGGAARQRPARRAEQIARTRAAELGTRLVGRGWRWSRVAGCLHVTRPHAASVVSRATAAPAPLGRPVQRSPRDARNAVIRFLDEHGPHVGVPTLRTCFPAMSRAELTDLLRRYRRVWRRRNRVPLRVLELVGAGRVWAIDFTGPRAGDRGPLPVPAGGARPGQRPSVALAAGGGRDRPRRARRAGATLFAEHGPPLVLKSDNGSPFTSAAVRGVAGGARRVGVVLAAVLAAVQRRDRGGDRLAEGADRRRGRRGPVTRASGPGTTWPARAPRPTRCRARAARRGRARTSCGRHAGADHGRGASGVRGRGRGGPARRTDAASESCAEGGAVVGSEASVARSAIGLALERCGYLQYRRRINTPTTLTPKSGQLYR